MATTAIDPSFYETNVEANAAPAQPELLMSSVLHLMSHYTVNAGETDACNRLAAVIERHLKALAAQSDLAPVLRATCQQLSEQWNAVVERALPRPKKTNLLTWLVAGTNPK